MPGSRPLLVVPLSAGVLAVWLTACGSSPQESTPEENASQVCVAADAFAGALKGFRDTLEPGVTIGELRSARDQVRNTYNDLAESSKDVAEDRMEAVESATDELADAVDAVPDDATVAQAIESLRNETSDVETALGDLTDELSC